MRRNPGELSPAQRRALALIVRYGVASVGQRTFAGQRYATVNVVSADALVTDGFAERHGDAYVPTRLGKSKMGSVK